MRWGILQQKGLIELFIVELGTIENGLLRYKKKYTFKNYIDAYTFYKNNENKKYIYDYIKLYQVKGSKDYDDKCIQQ